MATKDNWQADFARLRASEDYQSWDLATQQAESVRFFQNRVQMSPQYQKADLKAKQGIELSILGSIPDGIDPAAGMMPAPPAPPPTPSGFPPTSNPLQPNVRGALADRAAGGAGANILSRLSEFAQGQMQSGGMMSPEVQGTMGGEVIGMGLGAVGGPAMAKGAGVVGAGLGAMGGRGYEMLTDPSQRPEGIMAGLSDLGQAGQRGVEASMLGQMAGGAMGAVGQKLRRPLGAPTTETLATGAASKEAGIDLTAGQMTGNRRLQLAEEIPQRVILGGKKAHEFSKQQIRQNESAILKIAEAKSPGVLQDWSEVGAGMQSAVKARSQRAQEAVSGLYDHSKNLVGDGQFAMANLTEAAGGVVRTEAPTKSLANRGLGIARPFTQAPTDPVAQALAEAGFTPQELYTYPEILLIKQRLGNVIRRTTDRPLRRELLTMQTAVGQDLRDATVAAGAPEATQIVDRANNFFFTHIVKTFRDPEVLKVIAARPSLAAKMFMRPGISVEAVDALRRAAGPNQFAAIGRAWYENLAKNASSGGTFNAPQFAEVVRNMPTEVVKAITRGQSHQLNKLMGIFQKEGQGTIATAGTSRASLSTGQLIPLVMAGVSGAGGLLGGYGLAGFATGIAGGGAVGVAIPEIIGRVLYSPGGIRWLTVGLQAKPGTNSFTKALSKLTEIAQRRPTTLALSQAGGIAATRPDVTQALGRMGQAAGLPAM